MFTAGSSRRAEQSVRCSMLSFQKVDQQDRLSYTEDIDLTELLTKLTRQQLTYQTVLQSSSKIMRGWLGFIACLLVLALVACNVWLLRNWLEARHLGDDLRNADKTIEEQRRQLVNLIERISVVGRDLERVQSFDAKLRIMPAGAANALWAG